MAWGNSYTYIFVCRHSISRMEDIQPGRNVATIFKNTKKMNFFDCLFLFLERELSRRCCFVAENALIASLRIGQVVESGIEERGLPSVVRRLPQVKFLLQNLPIALPNVQKQHSQLQTLNNSFIFGFFLIWKLVI